ncbi:enolase C-terminal domain-like protein [Luteibacter sp. CQ10]|uniref:enolase C-terminal domain-like protein n=1 Tax=Luteibacter sp. CQ10 TaxID=2805821 RepID=UPI0034A5C088
MAVAVSPSVDEVHAQAWTVPTPERESDGTLGWASTTLVAVHVRGGALAGFGYTYASAAAADLINEVLGPAVRGAALTGIERIWDLCWQRTRNLGQPGLVAMAVSALDVALWDAKARWLSLPLAQLLGPLRDVVPVYGSGGLTSMTVSELKAQLGDWVHENGCRAVKMKIGADLEKDLSRVEAVRSAIGDAALMVDANGAYARKDAARLAHELDSLGVIWFEEPVSSDDVDGLGRLVTTVPAGVAIAAGEYVYRPDDALRLLRAGAVDVLQADATRCGGITGLRRVAALADAFHVPLSLHCAPALHLHVACALPGLMHVEWFVDHVRIEQAWIDGAPSLRNGEMAPNWSEPGHGLTLRPPVDADQWRVR